MQSAVDAFISTHDMRLGEPGHWHFDGADHELSSLTLEEILARMPRDDLDDTDDMPDLEDIPDTDDEGSGTESKADESHTSDSEDEHVVHWQEKRLAAPGKQACKPSTHMLM